MFIPSSFHYTEAVLLPFFTDENGLFIIQKIVML